MEEVINVTAVVESTFPLPTNATTLTDEAQGSPPTLSWIVAGVVGGLFLLIVVLLLVINIAVAVVVTKKRRKKKYNVSGQDVKICQQNTSNVTNTVTLQMRALKYHRGISTATDRSTSIDSHSHVTVGRIQSGQHKHMQVVNKDYLFRASNEAHQNDRVATHDQKRSLKPRVALLSKPRENEGEDYDSDYSEVAITTKAANTSKVRETEESLGISIHQNVAYELDEEDIATVNSLRPTAVFGSPIKSSGGLPPPQVKKPPAVKVKPRRRMTSSSSNFEASTLYDAPNSNRPLCLEDSTVDSVYDMVRSEYGEEVETALADHEDIPQPQQQSTDPQYTNTSRSIRGPAQERSGGYYNQRDLELMKHDEVLYANLKEDSADYQNLKKKSDTGKVFYGNLNQKKDTEERDYYNRREMMLRDNN